ncbi:hypothetical protein [Furfurilactobacillus siliginis]|uniref:Uncharacterized protein n=1 Tax=Furfurilactobacillus siliginis TaxID=348151 RepID=A0A510VWC7_9LACO|nr:hypothetical protein [Furfurilactobacillus siliginis]GEK29285.1 hypothetical protein LSI01_15960 [Furfurilactobacillus siliginis]
METLLAIGLMILTAGGLVWSDVKIARTAMAEIAEAKAIDEN